jgi:hypothetical protein
MGLKSNSSMQFKMNRKGMSLNDLANIGMVFVLLGVILAIGSYINSSIVTTAGWTAAANQIAYYAVANSTSGLATLSSWLPLIAVICAAGVVLGVLVSAFVVNRTGV